MRDQNVVERAFELAGAGRCHSMQELGMVLRREGYLQVAEHLTGPTVRRQLRNLIAEGRRAKMQIVEERAEPRASTVPEMSGPLPG